MKCYKYTEKAPLLPVFLVIVSTAIALMACTKNFKDYNTNPNGLTDSILKLDNAGLGAFFPQMQTTIIPNGINAGDFNNYQVSQGLSADLYSGYMGTPTNFSGNVVNNTTYFMSWHDATFNLAYSSIMSPWFQIRSRAAVTQPDFYAIATILKVEGMHRATDVYGPLPYSKFGQGGFEVDYDSQEAMYTSFFKELDSAILLLGNYVQANPSLTPFKNLDLVYNGDYKQWIKFANSLKLRLAIHIAYASPGLAKQMAEEAVGNSYGVLTLAGIDDAKVSPVNGIPIFNPLYGIQEGYNDIRAGAVLGSFLLGYKDPRLIKYMLPSTLPTGEYVGIRNGINIVNKSDRMPFSGINVTSASPIQWMTAAEVCFLKAEGALRGWTMGGTAQDFYKQGVQASFTQHSAGDAAAYLEDATSKAAPYIDPVNNANNVAASSTDLSTITIKWNEADVFEKKLERIITQKWLAMFPEGQEAWTEFRRTGYPKIWPVVVNNSNGQADTKIQIRRLTYPNSEYTNNPEGVNAAKALLNGNDYTGTKLWWDKK